MAFTDEKQSFTINTTGEITGQQFPGKFTVRMKLAHRDNLRRDQFRRDLLGPGAPDASVEANRIATVFSKIWIHLTEAPTWWKEASNGLDLVDEAPVSAVYDGILKLEREAFEALKKDAAGAKDELKTTVEKAA